MKIKATLRMAILLGKNLVSYYLLPKEKRYCETEPLPIIKEIYGTLFPKGAQKYIKSTVETSQYHIIRLKDIDLPVYWPKSLSLRDFHMLLLEAFEPKSYHRYEIPEAQVKKGDIVVDCGAAEGLFSLSILKKAKRIYLIEPLPDFISSLRMTFRRQHKCHLLPLAVGTKEGSVWFSNHSISSKIVASSASTNKVESTTLDKLFYKKGIKPDFIKADIEGGEENMLKGAQKTIAQMKPKIAITAYHGDNNVQRIINFVRKLAPDYQFRAKGLALISGKPVMLHFWTT